MKRVGRAISTVAVLVALSACATSPATRFYVLSPVITNDTEPIATSAPVTIGVRDVRLPEELDRPQIVTRTGANTVHLAEFDRWSAPLVDSVRQQIAENLAALLPRDRVEAYPWTPGTRVDREVVVEITQLDGTLGGRCTLRARWTVRARGATASAVSGHTTLSEASGRDYASLVAAHSRLLGALSAEIADAIRNESRKEVRN